MGILTSDPYENAWIIVGLGAAAIIVASIIGGGVFLAAKDKVPTLDDLVCTALILISALIPLGLFSSGFFIDFINQSYQYSTGSIVGFFGALVTSIFGSSAFADFSKKITSMFPSFYKASDVPGVPSEWNWWVLILTSIIIAVPIGVSFGVGGTQWGEGITIGIVVPFVLFLLAGNGLMGSFSSSTPAPMMGGSTFQINPYPSGYCDVPGFTWAANKMAPVSIVLTQTILWFHMIQDWATGDSQHTIMMGTGSLLIFALQWLGLSKNGCLESYRSGIYSPILSLVISIAVAAASYGVLKNMPATTGLSGPATVKPMPAVPGSAKLVCPGGYKLAPNGDCERILGPNGTQFEKQILVGGQQNTSAPVDDDQDAFVCEAYKDGELVTSTIVE
jgi:hypothetical protein